MGDEGVGEGLRGESGRRTEGLEGLPGLICVEGKKRFLKGRL